MRRGLLVALFALALPANALAGPCGLPDSRPLWIDFGTPDLQSVFARPGTIVTSSTGTFPAELREAGAKTIYWDMNLKGRVGTPTAPADPTVIEERANRLFVFAASQTQCATPWIAFNELFGADLETPWTPNNAQYRANVLNFLRALARLGARPFLLINAPAYTGGEAREWWLSVAAVADIVREVYFSARTIWVRGPIRGNRHLRGAFRKAVANLVRIGIPVSRVGIMLGFYSAPGIGGRDRLAPDSAWFNTIKWQALSARQVAAEMKIATVWSWGWGTYSVAGRDPDKPRAACVWLWARSPRLCDASAIAGKGFSTSRTEGQLILRPGAQCRIGGYTISTWAIARLNTLVHDRDVAYTALLARLAEAKAASVTAREVAAAEAAIVAASFGGSRGAYRAALAKAGARPDIARAIVADELRRLKIGAQLHVPRPSAGAIVGFYLAYPDVLVRNVHAEHSPWWLAGRQRGLTLSTSAPPQVFSLRTGQRTTVVTVSGRFAIRPLDEAQTLGSVSLAQARPAIAAALEQYARADRVLTWSTRQQEAMLREAVCLRDDLPMIGSADLDEFLPFAALAG